MLTDLRAGVPEALAAVYRSHAARLLRTAYCLTGSVADAEDVVQDLFVGLPEALASYEERGVFEAWLNAIVIRMALMRMRRASRRREVGLEAGPKGPAGGSGETRLEITTALNALSPSQRIVVVLFAIEGYSHQEIGELLGIRRGTSEVRLHRGLARLRKLLTEEP
jgi:RNA polymerase sigma-70 factor (ECF subfamily)